MLGGRSRNWNTSKKGCREVRRVSDTRSIVFIRWSGVCFPYDLFFICYCFEEIILFISLFLKL